MTYDKDADDLMEKYYHSMGAALIEEGDLEEAVIFLHKAIDIQDTPYAWYGLACALKGAGDTAGAIGAMTKAIKLAPGTSEYHHERGLLLRELGRPDLADEDIRKAVALDKNYERIDKIIEAERIVNETVFGRPLPEDINKEEIRNEDIVLIMDEMALKRQHIADVFRKPSCPVRSCPAYCCHFTGKLLKHGVTIGPWKLNALRKHFTEKGITEKDLLETFPVEQTEYAESLFAPQDIMKNGGVRSVTFPRQKDRSLGVGSARDIPKGRGYRTLMWIDEGARPCVFLEDGKCSIYDVGGEPSLDPCASFLCMTGFVFMVLKCLGIIDEAVIERKTMKELNDIAVDALITLAQDVCGSEEAAASERAILDELRSAVEADRSGSTDRCEAAIRQCRVLAERHNVLIDKNISAARQKLIKYLS